ncbi:hypothetical protein ACIQGZ_17375 [Streptomyces sp. NPDC092296]|uniref:hypothetical protein n=1 Tax=Streptomyces sp. NPDC092296 TaxID=3366012 RepID=UPI0038174FED
MTGLSPSRRGEHAPAPGATWGRELTRVERVVPDDFDDIRANRADRRAAKRAARRKGRSR